MTTPFQNFIALAQRVFDATSITEPIGNPCNGIEYLSKTSIRFNKYPFDCRIQLIEHQGFQTSVDISFTSPLDADYNEFDQLFIEWTKNVDDFIASNSPLLIDNQIKSILNK